MTGGKRDAEAAGYILAGGGSRRFGRDKALVEVGGFPMLRRMIALLQSVAKNVKVVGVAGKIRAVRKRNSQRRMARRRAARGESSPRFRIPLGS